jgi:hypothetical protein
MGRRLTLRYDREGDILYLDRCPAYSQQESVEVIELPLAVDFTRS